MSEHTWKVPPETEEPTGDAQAAPLPAGEGPGPTGTLRVPSDTVAAPPQPASKPLPSRALGELSPGEILYDEYEVIKTMQPNERLLPGLYLCKEQDGTQVMVKAAALQFPPRPDLWALLPSLQHRNVLRTLRAVEHDGFYFEVQEFCDGGSLDDYVPRPGATQKPLSSDAVTDGLIGQLHEGLEYLHEHGIVHRDLKPANIYLKRSPNGHVLAVLGDFDIASVLGHMRTSRITERAGGTWVYAAPETFPRFMDETGRVGAQVSYASDYYSLGVTLIELLVGITSLQTCKLSDLYDFYLQGNRIAIPENIPDRLRLLLRGLLIRNRETRWGAQALHRWLENGNTPDDLRSIEEDEQYNFTRAARPYRLKDQTAYDLPGLARAMAHEPHVAMDDLMNSDILLQWIAGLDSNIAREVLHARSDYVSAPELALWSTILLCDPTEPYRTFDGMDAHSLEEWFNNAAHRVAMHQADPADLCADVELQKLAIWLRAKSDPEPEQAAALIRLLHSPASVRLEEIAYHLQQDRPFFIMKGVAAKTPQDFVRLAYGNPEDWREGIPPVYQAAYARWANGSLAAWLRQHGLDRLAMQAHEVQEELRDAPYAAFETLLRLLDPELPPVQVAVNTEPLARCYALPYNSSAILVQVPYRTVGCGIPFGMLDYLDVFDGMTIENKMIKQRCGIILIRLTPELIPIEDERQQAPVRLESTLAVLQPESFEISYQLTCPPSMLVRYLAGGALIGLLLLGIIRLFVSIAGVRLLPAVLAAHGGSLQLPLDDPQEVVVWIIFMFLVVMAGVTVRIFWRRASLSREPIVPGPTLAERLEPLLSSEEGTQSPAAALIPIAGFGLVFCCIAGIAPIPGMAVCYGLDWLFTAGGLIPQGAATFFWFFWGAVLGLALGTWHVLPFYGGKRTRWVVALPFVLLILLGCLGILVLSLRTYGP